MRKLAGILTMVAAVAFVTPASAGPITGSSLGTLILTGDSPDMGRAASNGPKKIEWGYDQSCKEWGWLGCRAWRPLWNSGSVLEAIDVPFTVDGPSSGKVLAKLRWKNRETGILTTDEWLAATWDIAFTVPGGEASPAVPMRINNTFSLLYPGADWTQFAMHSLDGFSLTIDGWRVSNFQYAVLNGVGAFDPGDNVWSNPECGESYLGLTADFTPVPEPTSMVLLGTGLLGLVRASRRRIK